MITIGRLICAEPGPKANFCKYRRENKFSVTKRATARVCCSVGSIGTHPAVLTGLGRDEGVNHATVRDVF